MTPILLQPPAVEPLSLAEAKAWLRVDHADEDDLIAGLVVSARAMVETFTRCVLIEQTWRVTLDDWPPDRVVRLAPGPFRSLVAARVIAADETAQPVAPSHYALDASPHAARLRILGDAPRPGRLIAGVEIDFMAGYGPSASDVPAPLRQAIRLLVARLYERRGDSDVETGAAFPADLAALLAPWRRARLS